MAKKQSKTKKKTKSLDKILGRGARAGDAT